MKKYVKPVLEVVEIENDAILSACASGVDNDTALCEDLVICQDYMECNDVLK
ncbi:MAG: hypothetical protein IKI24_00845 [Clostridia bacterium]|jgi:hypothetical protein|nr:hypothetical protein [Clostridia bacterium]